MRDTGLPPGLTAEAWEKMKQQQKQLKNRAAPVVEPVEARPKVLATGLSAEDTWTTVSSKATKKKKKQTGENGEVEEVANQIAHLVVTNGSGPKITNESGQPLATDPVKRLKNLRKKLADIEKLKLRDSASLDKDQLEKIGRYQEVKDMIEDLEAAL